MFCSCDGECERIDGKGKKKVEVKVSEERRQFVVWEVALVA